MDLTAQLSALLGNKPAANETPAQVAPIQPVSAAAASIATPVVSSTGSVPSAVTTPVVESTTPTVSTSTPIMDKKPELPPLPTQPITTTSTIPSPAPVAAAPVIPSPVATPTPLQSNTLPSPTQPVTPVVEEKKDQLSDFLKNLQNKGTEPTTNATSSALPPLPPTLTSPQSADITKEMPKELVVPTVTVEKPKDPIETLPTPPQPPLSPISEIKPLEMDKKPELPQIPQVDSQTIVEPKKEPVLPPLPEQKSEVKENAVIETKVPEIKPEQPKIERKIDATKMKFWTESQQVIAELEKAWNAKVITVYIPMKGKLSNSTVNEMYYHVAKLGKIERLALVIYGPGGKGTAALRLVKMIRSYVKYLIVAVPDIAASAMTMLAMGADQLVMSPIAMLSPVDTSVTHPLAPKAAQSHMPVSIEITQIKKYLEMVKADAYHGTQNFNDTAEAMLSEHVHPVVLGHMQRAASLSTMITEKILATHMKDKAKVSFIAKTLSEEFPSHDFPIFMEDALSMGVNAMDMSAEDISRCGDLFEYYKILTTDVMSVDGKKKLMVSRTAIIESIDLRSWFHNEETLEQKEDGKWARLSEYHDFMRAIPLKTRDNEYVIKPANFMQFKEWMKKGEVEDKS
jgi:hypothetical protein